MKPQRRWSRWLRRAVRVGPMLATTVFLGCSGAVDVIEPELPPMIYTTGSVSVQVDVESVCYGSTCLSVSPDRRSFEVPAQPVSIQGSVSLYCYDVEAEGLEFAWRNETTAASGEARWTVDVIPIFNSCVTHVTASPVPLEPGLNWIVIATRLGTREPGEVHIPVTFSP